MTDGGTKEGTGGNLNLGVLGAGEREDPDVCCGQLALGGSSPEALGWIFDLCGGAFATVAARLRRLLTKISWTFVWLISPAQSCSFCPTPTKH